MKADATGIDTPQFLSGWKDIANYLGKGVRTVQRYERELGLPVRRPAGKARGSVVVTRAEIDAWVAASPVREAFHLNRVPGISLDLTNTIKRGVSDMTRLRERIIELRDNLERSVQLLHATVATVREASSRNFRLGIASSPWLNLDSEDKRILELVQASAPRAKAS